MNDTTLQGVTLVIPAYRPDPVLGELVQALAAHDAAEIVIVDDGSDNG